MWLQLSTNYNSSCCDYECVSCIKVHCLKYATRNLFHHFLTVSTIRRRYEGGKKKQQDAEYHRDRPRYTYYQLQSDAYATNLILFANFLQTGCIATASCRNTSWIWTRDFGGRESAKPMGGKKDERNRARCSRRRLNSCSSSGQRPCGAVYRRSGTC